MRKSRKLIKFQFRRSTSEVFFFFFFNRTFGIKKFNCESFAHWEIEKLGYLGYLKHSYISKNPELYKTKSRIKYLTIWELGHRKSRRLENFLYSQLNNQSNKISKRKKNFWKIGGKHLDFTEILIYFRSSEWKEKLHLICDQNSFTRSTVQASIVTDKWFIGSKTLRQTWRVKSIDISHCRLHEKL